MCNTLNKLVSSESDWNRNFSLKNTYQKNLSLLLLFCLVMLNPSPNQNSASEHAVSQPHSEDPSGSLSRTRGDEVSFPVFYHTLVRCSRAHPEKPFWSQGQTVPALSASPCTADVPVGCLLQPLLCIFQVKTLSVGLQSVWPEKAGEELIGN